MRIFSKTCALIWSATQLKLGFSWGHELLTRRILVVVLSAEATNADSIRAAQQKGSGLEEAFPVSQYSRLISLRFINSQ